MNLKDERLHMIGFAEIEKIGESKDDSDSVKVTLTFRGGVMVIVDVPKKIFYPSGSASPFNDRQMVYVDYELQSKPQVRTFNGNSYAVNDIAIGRIVEFRSLNKDER